MCFYVLFKKDHKWNIYVSQDLNNSFILVLFLLVLLEIFCCWFYGDDRILTTGCLICWISYMYYEISYKQTSPHYMFIWSVKSWGLSWSNNHDILVMISLFKEDQKVKQASLINAGSRFQSVLLNRIYNFAS